MAKSGSCIEYAISIYDGMGKLRRAFYLWLNNAPVGVVSNYLATSCRKDFRHRHADAVKELRQFAQDNDFKYD